MNRLHYYTALCAMAGCILLGFGWLLLGPIEATNAAGTVPNQALSFAPPAAPAAIPVAQSTPGPEICDAVTEIPKEECLALLNLFNSTRGTGWFNQSGWGKTTTICNGGWYGISCLNGHVYTILLTENNLSGSFPSQLHLLTQLNTLRLDLNDIFGFLPKELAQVTTLEKINLTTNRLRGTIPAEWGTMTNLRNLHLRDNEFSGAIPSQLQGMVNLEKLHLARNTFSGEFPQTICQLTKLTELTMGYNQFVGEFPDCIRSLQGLTIGDTLTGFGYNGFWSNNATIRQFLDIKDPDWESTQTIPPSNFQAVTVTPNQIVLNWTPIPYQGDGGYYEIQLATVPSGPFTTQGQTASKSSSNFTVGNLQANTTYYLQIRTFTPVHEFQKNSFSSPYTAALVVTTLPPIPPTDTLTPTPTHTPTNTPTATSTNTGVITPADTPTVTPTFTPTFTPTPTSTPDVPGGGTEVCPPSGGVDRCNIVFLSYMSKVIPTITPTPTATIAIPAGWQRFARSAGDIDVLAVTDNALLAGERSDNNSVKGIYRIQNCALGGDFDQRHAGIRIQDLAFRGANGIAATNGHKLYYSGDQGVTWQQSSSGTNAFVFATAFVNDGSAYAGADDGVYQSTNFGQTWSKVAPNGAGPLEINAFAYDSATNTLWIATEESGVWKHRPGTNNFEQRIGGLAKDPNDKVIWDIKVRSSGEIYLATTNGVYRGNGEANWAAYELQKIQILSLEIVGNRLYAGTKEAGLFSTELIDNPEWSLDSGLNSSLTIRELHYDATNLCNDAGSDRHALLAGTTDGIWVYR